MKWSYRIVILYLGFVTLILSLVFISNNNREELVSRDYYKRELEYQKNIDAQTNEKKLAESITHHVDRSAVMLQLPEEMMKGRITGKIFFYCPASSKNDRSYEMDFNHDGRQYIIRNELVKGSYKMQLSWNLNNKEYFREDIIVIK